MNHFGNGGNGLAAAIVFRIKFRQNNGDVRLAFRQVDNTDIVAGGRNLTGFMRHGGVCGKTAAPAKCESRGLGFHC